MNFKQAYMTTTYPVDKDGNYYYVVYVPETANVQMPITEVVPKNDLGGKGLKFDWTTGRWIVSDADPTVQAIKKLQNEISDQQQMTLMNMKDILNAPDKGGNN